MESEWSLVGTVLAIAGGIGVGYLISRYDRWKEDKDLEKRGWLPASEYASKEREILLAKFEARLDDLESRLSCLSSSDKAERQKGQ
jgi:hypothetical protein